MGIIRSFLKNERDKYVCDISGKENFLSVYDILKINNKKGSETPPNFLINYALRGTIVKEKYIKNVKTYFLNIDVSNKYFKDTKVDKESLFFYIHGGGFCGGFALQGAYFMKSIMCRLGVSAMAVEYSLSPKEIYPKSLNEIYEVYLEIIKKFNPKKIIIGGESAGANLCVALLLKIREEKQKMPKCAILSSGFYDLTSKQASHKYNTATDISLTTMQTKFMGRAYVCGVDVKNKEKLLMLKCPLVSLIFADLKGLPPLFINACTDEILYDDSAKLYSNAKKAKVNSVFYTDKDCFHAYMALGDFLKESKIVIDKATQFINSLK